MVSKVVLLMIALTVPGVCFAQSAARQIGRVAGDFGAGVGEAAMEPLTSMRAEWITIPPRPKDVCMAESGGVVDTTFMRCRNGWQEYVRFDRDGRKKVISERSIPVR